MPYSERNSIVHTHNEFINDIFQKWELTLAQLYHANKTICNLERTVQQRTESYSRESTLLRKELVAVSRENLDLQDIIKQKDAEISQLNHDMQYAEPTRTKDNRIKPNDKPFDGKIW